MILGLPGHTYERIMEDAARLAKLDIQGVKFHALHVLKDTRLAQVYARGDLVLLTQEEYIRDVCDFMEYLPEDMVILRLVSSALKDQLVAPDWLGDKAGTIAAINNEMERRGTRQGCRIR